MGLKNETRHNIKPNKKGRKENDKRKNKVPKKSLESNTKQRSKGVGLK